MTPALTIITPVFDNLSGMVQTIRQVKDQTLEGIEHIVVSDGPNLDIAGLCRHFGVKCLQLPKRMMDWGKPALDLGLKHATAHYVCFWDDDNFYPPDAAQKLLSAAEGYDLGLVQIHHWDQFHHSLVVLPRQWNGTVQIGDIDTGNGCVRREYLQEQCLTPGTIAPGNVTADALFWIEIQRRGGSVNFVPVVALMHI